MTKSKIKSQKENNGSVLALVLIVMAILSITGFALLKSAQGKMTQAIRIKSEESASSAAEAGYEKAVFWMSQQVDLLSSLQTEQSSGSLDFAQSSTDYNVSLASFYLLGYVSTLFWMGQPWYLGILPAFAIFLVLFVITLRTAYVKEHSGQGDMEVHA